MLGKVKELIIDSTQEDEDIFSQLEAGEDDNVSAIEIKAYADCAIEVNGEEFTIDKDEVLSLPYNFMKVLAVTALTAGVKLKIRYLVD